MTTPASHTTSTGHAMAGGAWLDRHFQAARPEYEAAMRSAGFEPGWHVLDAGCGGGSFLPLLAELVGPTGRVTALDLAPENIATVEERIAAQHLACPVTAQAGSILALPFPDDAFDAVWCANVTQYLTDDELTSAVAELKRVVRPGGLVAVKDTDLAACYLSAPNRFLYRRAIKAGYSNGNRQILGALRGPALQAWLTGAGFDHISTHTVMIERHAPHNSAVQQYLIEFYRVYCDTSPYKGISSDEASAFAWLAEHCEEWVMSSDHYFREAQVLATGIVPGN